MTTDSPQTEVPAPSIHRGWRPPVAVVACALVLVAPLHWLPLLLRAPLLLAAFLFGAFAARGLSVAPGTRVGRAIRPLAWIGLVLAFTEGACGMAVDRLLENPTRRTAYHQAFESSEDEFGVAINFVPHHHLNYALNPELKRGGETQFNREFLIRRAEPIRPKKDVRWRALCIGGSTTFGAQLAREQDTWVYRLETKVRGRAGPAVDVVNGGVGGYTSRRTSSTTSRC